MKANDLTGMKFDKLTVICLDEQESAKPRGKDGRKERYYICKCDCGNIKTICGRSLVSGRTHSCGCHRKQVSKNNMAQLSQQQWQNENFKQMQSEKMKQRWEDEQYRQKMSDSAKSQWDEPQFRWFMQEQAWNQWQDEDFRQMQKEKPVLRGENHPRYNHDLTNNDRKKRRLIPEYNEWKNKVKERDNYTCKVCGKHGGKLCSHHLDGYNWCKEKRFDVENGVCLCDECHTKFHNRYGRGNNTKEQFKEFIEIIEE